MFQNDQTARLTSLVFCLFVAGFVGCRSRGQCAGTRSALLVVLGWIQDWFRNFGAGSTSATLGNPGRCAGHTERAPLSVEARHFPMGLIPFATLEHRLAADAVAGLTQRAELPEFDMGHNGVGNVNVQFFARPVRAALFGFGSDLAVATGIHTYSVPLTGRLPLKSLYPHHRHHSGTMQAKETSSGPFQEVRSVARALTSRRLPITTVAPRTLTV